MTDLPHQFREQQFRKYEKILLEALDIFPYFTDYDTRKQFNLSPITFASRFRDAMASLKEYKWKTAIDYDKFVELYPYIITAMPRLLPGIVRIGGKEVQANHLHPTLPSIVPSEHNILTLATFTDKLFLCDLATRRLLITPIKCFGFTESEVSDISKQFDVLFELQDDGSYLLS